MVSKNIIANIIGKGLSTILSFIFVPYYIKLLGAESYGLIGVYTTLLSIFMVADFGLSGAFTRETARLSNIQGGTQQLHNLGRTFEVLFLILGFIIALVIAVSSHILAENWVNVKSLSIATVSSSILLIGVIVGLQFPFFLYQGGLLGIQRQKLLNVLLVVIGILRGLGSIILLVLVEPTIQVFFLWQVLISILQLLAARMLMWKSFTNLSTRPQVDFTLITPLWRFAAGTAGITLSGIFLTQVDKIILAKMLPLEEFGYYTLAWVVASVPSMIAMPIYNAVYPRFIQLIAEDSISELTVVYHRASQVLAVLIIPIGLMLVFFSKEIMLLWTGNSETSNNTYTLISVLGASSAITGLMIVPYALQLAYAWTRLVFVFNLIGSLILIPLMVWFIPVYGALGACYSWFLINAAYMLILIHLMHRRILQDEKWKWYFNDIARSLVLSLPIVIIGDFLPSYGVTRLFIAIKLMCILVVSVCVASLGIASVRKMILRLPEK